MTDAEELRRRIMEVLEYDPETGLFRWKVRYNNAQKTGWFQGNLHGNEGQKHRQIQVFGKQWKAHRLAWFIMTGSLPVFEIDHEDQDKDKRRKRYLASIRIDGKSIHLGRFSSIEEAASSRAEANLKYGFHANHGSKEK